MNYANPELREALAAEYALGTLQGAVKRRFEGLMRDDRALRDLVADWQGRLNPLAEWVRPVQPPAHVWTAIANAVGVPAEEEPAPQASLLSRLWDSMPLWRAVASVSAAVIVAFIIYFSIIYEPIRPSHIAILVDQSGQPLWVAGLDETDSYLTLKPVAAPAIEAGKSLELWLVSSVGEPRSLGLLTPDGYAANVTRGQTHVLLRSSLAVSVEPEGGSHTGAPTGPIVGIGHIVPNI
jgi:anti-sigma-K factor RskA